MSKKDPLAPPPPPNPSAGERWTRPEDYLDMGRLWRRSAARLRRTLKPRTEPENPRLMLGTLPFLLLMGTLAVMAVLIIIAAIPGRRVAQTSAEEPQREVGTAPPGWLER